MKVKSFHLSIALVCLVLGLMLSVQYRAVREIKQNEAVQRAQELSDQVKMMKKEREVLQASVSRMRSELENLSAGPLSVQMKEEMALASTLAGVTELAGSGVEVTLKDSGISLTPGDNPNLYLVHDEDILKVVNELKAAGAEAISVNGQRFIATTEINCNGPTIRINKKPLAPPFVITTIGDPETLGSALQMKGGVAETLRFFGIQVSVKKLSQVTVPAYTGGVKYEYASEAKKGN